MTIAECLNHEIEIMPQTDQTTLCVTMKDVVSRESYRQCIEKPLDKIVQKTGKYSLLVNYDPSFKGWSQEAAALSFETIIKYGLQAVKLAYVNAPDSKRLQINVARPLFGGEIRFFDQSELQEALHWVKT